MPRSKNGQLTQGDRMAIEQQLKDCTPLPEIARGLGVAPSTVAREIQRRRGPILARLRGSRASDLHCRHIPPSSSRSIPHARQ